MRRKGINNMIDHRKYWAQRQAFWKFWLWAWYMPQTAFGKSMTMIKKWKKVQRKFPVTLEKYKEKILIILRNNSTNYLECGWKEKKIKQKKMRKRKFPMLEKATDIQVYIVK